MNNKILVAFSFDDGRGDNIDLAKNYLLPNSIPATFNITTGYVDGTAAADDLPTDKKAISIEDIKWLFKQNIFEIALHGDKHKNTINDVENGRIKFCQWLEIPDNSSFGFASPSSSMKYEDYKNHSEYFDSDVIKYVRSGNLFAGSAFTKAQKINGVISKIIKKQNLISRIFNRIVDFVFYQKIIYNLSNENSMIDTVDSKFIHSITVFRGTSPNIIISSIKYAIRHKKSVILMMHSVIDGDEDIYSYRKNDFIKICDFLKKQERMNKLSVVTVEKLYSDYSRKE